ncbi:hypothetical protein GDO78_014389 [Eleutherodactylus coqui]|uniref:Uncharacterized protein n=1 Tax=Eleutherodactylus coqui TaxID=57060 RepID=A0A8J6B359_ELECQ|nr:hypothetical protein GDO78_014389 [Eleutherodactylus coqui]
MQLDANFTPIQLCKRTPVWRRPRRTVYRGSQPTPTDSRFTFKDFLAAHSSESNPLSFCAHKYAINKHRRAQPKGTDQDWENRTTSFPKQQHSCLQPVYSITTQPQSLQLSRTDVLLVLGGERPSSSNAGHRFTLGASSVQVIMAQYSQ